jgi:hypothetical protein
MKKPRARVKMAFNIYQKKMAAKQPFSMQEVLEEAGYSPSYARSSTTLTDSKSWKMLLSKYPEEPILDVVYRDALGFGREANENRKLFLKVKGRLKDTVSLDINKERENLFESEED